MVLDLVLFEIDFFLLSPTKEKKQSDTKPTYWLILCRENGVLEVNMQGLI